VEPLALLRKYPAAVWQRRAALKLGADFGDEQLKVA
jgi:hypothetical protein